MNYSDGVYNTGFLYIATARKVILNRGAHGQPENTYFDFIYQPMRDAAGQVEGILIHGNDVTQQVLARQEIEKREQQFRTLAESIPQLVWMAESDGYIFWYNQRWYKYTGTTPEQMEGWGWQTVHDPDVLPKVSRAMEALDRKGRAVRDGVPATWSRWRISGFSNQGPSRKGREWHCDPLVWHQYRCHGPAKSGIGSARK